MIEIGKPIPAAIYQTFDIHDKALYMNNRWVPNELERSRLEKKYQKGGYVEA